MKETNHDKMPSPQNRKSCLSRFISEIGNERFFGRSSRNRIILAEAPVHPNETKLPTKGSIGRPSEKTFLGGEERQPATANGSEEKQKAKTPVNAEAEQKVTVTEELVVPKLAIGNEGSGGKGRDIPPESNDFIDPDQVGNTKKYDLMSSEDFKDPYDSVRKALQTAIQERDIDTTSLRAMISWAQSYELFRLKQLDPTNDTPFGKINTAKRGSNKLYSDYLARYIIIARTELPNARDIPELTEDQSNELNETHKIVAEMEASRRLQEALQIIVDSRDQKEKSQE